MGPAKANIQTAFEETRTQATFDEIPLPTTGVNLLMPVSTRRSILQGKEEGFRSMQNHRSCPSCP